MSKLAVIAKIVAAEGREDDLFARLEAAVASVADEAGTEIYSVHRDTRAPGTAWLFELYAGTEAIAVHQGSAAMRSLVADMGELAASSELAVVRPVAAKGLSDLDLSPGPA